MAEYQWNDQGHGQHGEHPAVHVRLLGRSKEYDVRYFKGREENHAANRCRDDVFNLIKTVGEDLGPRAAIFSPSSTAPAATKSTALWISSAATARLPEIAAIIPRRMASRRSTAIEYQPQRMALAMPASAAVRFRFCHVLAPAGCLRRFPSRSCARCSRSGAFMTCQRPQPRSATWCHAGAGSENPSNPQRVMPSAARHDTRTARFGTSAARRFASGWPSGKTSQKAPQETVSYRVGMELGSLAIRKHRLCGPAVNSRRGVP